MINDGMFKELVEAGDDIFIVTDQSFNIRYISSSIKRAFGAEPFDLIGKNIFNFVGKDKIAPWKNCLESSGSDPVNEEIALHIQNRKIYYDVQVSGFPKESSYSGLILKLHDISEKKLKEKELIKANQQLDQVIYKTTHDLKAPIMSAMGLVNLAENASAEEKDVYLDMIKKSLKRLDSFIVEMNHFFRNDKLAIQRERIDVKNLLNEELKDIQSLYQRQKIDIQVRIEGNPDFYSDSIRLRTIVANMLSNAVKYCDPEKTRPFIKIYVFIKEEFCEFRFVDNGIGIDPELQPKIFDLFFRATNQSQGTGLGLFIVKDTIEKLKGKIEVESASGAGTTFKIQLPNQILQPLEVG